MSMSLRIGNCSLILQSRPDGCSSQWKQFPVNPCWPCSANESMKILEFCSIADNITSTLVISVEIWKLQLFYSACWVVIWNFAKSYTDGIMTQEVVTVLWENSLFISSFFLGKRIFQLTHFKSTENISVSTSPPSWTDEIFYESHEPE